VVAGAPGTGKSTAAAILAGRLRPVPAVLDKDALFGGFVAEVLGAHGRPHGEREGPWYDEHVKRHEYGGMTAAARQIRAAGCPVMVVAPFTGQIRDVELWVRWVGELGGEPVRLIWVTCGPDTLRRRLIARGTARDAGKLADFDAFLERMRPDQPPPVPHLALDTSAGAAATAVQLAAILTPEGPR
jgi:predicted kinase